jgi:hypothetical protein
MSPRHQCVAGVPLQILLLMPLMWMVSARTPAPTTDVIREIEGYRQTVSPRPTSRPSVS